MWLFVWKTLGIPPKATRISEWISNGSSTQKFLTTQKLVWCANDKLLEIEKKTLKTKYKCEIHGNKFNRNAEPIHWKL